MENVHPVAFIAALILVTIWHELGHLVAARLVVVPVRRIYVGLGPIIWRSAIGRETDLVLRALPIGMSVAVPGRWSSDGVLLRPLRCDLWMVAGGPLASFLLTALLFAAARWGGFSEAWGMALVGVGLLSALLALLNLLPIPGLDGGHLLLLLLARAGWSMPPRAEGRLHRWGLHLAVLVMLTPLLVLAWRTSTGA